MSSHDPLAAVPDEGVPLPQKPVYAEAHFDITAMIDLVFMMNIFFLVTSITDSLSEVDLPVAKHVKGADKEKAILVTMMLPEPGKPAVVYLGESQSTPLPEGKEQKQMIEEYINVRTKELIGAGKNKKDILLLIKAEKGVLHRDVARVSNIAATIEGLQLYLAVLEIDE